MSKPSQKSPTGEIFIMRPPANHADPQNKWYWDQTNSYKRMMKRWEALREAITLAGGTVETLPASEAIYVRDPVMVMHKPDGKPCTLVGDTVKYCSEELERSQALREELVQGERIALPGFIEGGNLVYDATRNILFWGVTNYHFLDDFAARTYHRIVEKTPADHQKRLEMAKPTAHGIEAVREQLGVREDLMRDGKPLRVVPLFIPDEHGRSYYHLDGLFNVLPTGQSVVLRDKLSKSANHLIEKHIGRKNVIDVEFDECFLRDPTNFITVGNTIITPYASPRLRDEYAKHGYDVIDAQSMGLPEDAWRFSPHAGPRCVTLKVTPDIGFPQAEKNRGPKAAVLVHAR